MGEQLKVFEYAKKIGVEPLVLMDKLRKWKLPVKSHMAALSEEVIIEIEAHLNKEASHSKDAKTKKVIKKKKTVAKKKAVSKKKTVVKKSITKKTAVSPQKSVEAKRTIIRRKAAIPQPTPLPVTVIPSKIAPEEEALPSEATTPPPPSPSSPPPASPTEREVAETKLRHNIVGRMDLKRVPNLQSGAASPRPQKTTHRNIRTGFVAMPIDMPPPVEVETREKEKNAKKKSGSGSGKEQVVQTFTATEFRKREVIFQPKKKRAGLLKDNKKTQLTTPKASKRVVRMHGKIKVSDLAKKIGVKAPLLVKKLVSEGVMAQLNSELDFDTASLFVPEFGFEAQNLHTGINEKIESMAFGDVNAEAISRPPVVTVMGHVDHGKTTLLDAIRSTNVVSGEAGGITQHIGAYRVTLVDEKVATFIDTPGHAAFTEMRARGANVTDIVVIVVAADDGVMPQTEEAINHAKAAGVPIIVAINKIDAPSANVEKIKQQLMEHELIPEEWGGTTLFAEVSALKKEGIDNLIEQIHLLAEMQEIKSNPNRSATGVVIESSIKKGRGNVATFLVKEGTLKVGDCIVAGLTVGRVRRMNSETGKVLKEATPGVPVEVSGLEGTPNAGDPFDVCQEEHQARDIATQRLSEKKKSEVSKSKISLEDLFSKITSGDTKELAVVLKSDVMGSNEAIKGMFAKIVHDEVKVKIIHMGVGGISESDILLAGTSGGIVIGFNVRPDVAAQQTAREKGVEVKTYSIIYELIDDVKKALSGMLRPDIVEKSQGQAEVREIFNIPKLGVIAGCSVVDGKVLRTSNLRLIREGRVIYEGSLGSLKRFKEDVKEVASGYECGIGIASYNDIKMGDIIEAYTNQEVARTLELEPSQ